MGRYDLKLSENDFWDLTLKDLVALIDRYKSNEEWLNYRTALISAIVANTARDPKRKPAPYTPDDFMPTGRKPKTQTPEQMFEQVKLLNVMFGGNVVED